MVAGATEPRVGIRVRGRTWEGWTEGTVQRVIDDACSTFALGATDRYPGQPHPLPILPGDSCAILIDGVPVLTGRIDIYETNHHGETTLSGRSATRNLVDCSVEQRDSIVGATLSSLAARLAAPYGVQVVDEVGLVAQIPRWTPQADESVIYALEPLAEAHAVILMDDALGRLVITRAAASRRATTALVAGGPAGNLLRWHVRCDASDRYSEYVCRGQRAGDDQTYGSACSSRGSATDDGLQERRVLHIRMDGQADAARCRERAIWEAARRAGRSLRVECGVQGWLQEDGSLWAPNTIAHVQIPGGRLDDDLLITSVHFNISESGTTTDFELFPLSGYVLLEPRVARPARSGGGHQVGLWKELTPIEEATAP